MSNTIPISNPVSGVVVQQSTAAKPAGFVDKAAVKVAAEAVETLDAIKTRIHDTGKEAKSVREGGAELSQRIREQLEEAARRLQQAVEATPTRLKFSVDEVGSRFVISVTDDATGELIRQVPGEAVLRIAHSIEKMKGVLFDKSL